VGGGVGCNVGTGLGPGVGTGVGRRVGNSRVATVPMATATRSQSPTHAS
jgi:hypothetical protein